LEREEEDEAAGWRRQGRGSGASALQRLVEIAANEDVGDPAHGDGALAQMSAKLRRYHLASPAAVAPSITSGSPVMADRIVTVLGEPDFSDAFLYAIFSIRTCQRGLP
jgi:hypothetical protein